MYYCNPTLLNVYRLCSKLEVLMHIFQGIHNAFIFHLKKVENIIIIKLVDFQLSAILFYTTFAVHLFFYICD